MTLKILRLLCIFSWESVEFVFQIEIVESGAFLGPKSLYNFESLLCRIYGRYL